MAIVAYGHYSTNNLQFPILVLYVSIAAENVSGAWVH